MPLPFQRETSGPGSLGREAEFGWLLFVPFSPLGEISREVRFLTSCLPPCLWVLPSHLAPLSYLTSPEWRLLLRTSPFPAPCFENHLSPLIYLPSPSSVAAAQTTPGEKSTPCPLCSTASGPTSIPKVWPVGPGSHLTSPNQSPPEDLQPSLRPHLTILITKLKAQGLGRPPACLQEYLLCPEYSPGSPGTPPSLSLDLPLPFHSPGNLGHPPPKGLPLTHMPKAQAQVSGTPLSCLLSWLPPLQVPVLDVGPSPCHSWQASWLQMRSCHC